MLRRRVLAALTVSSVLVALVGTGVPPAAASPVLATDTLRSGPGIAFGNNDKGQTSPSSTATKTLGAVPLTYAAPGNAPVTDAVSVAGGKGFALWANHLGEVWGIGDNTYGQRGNNTTGGVKTALKATLAAKAVKVSAYGLAAVALDDAGNVYQWGQVYNSSSQLVNVLTPTKLTFPSGTGRIIDIATGDGFALAMDDTYRVYGWGRNDSGQLGLNTTTTTPAPARITTGLPVVSGSTQALLDAGRDFGVYVTSSPTAGVAIYTWGRNNEHQLGNGSSTTSTKVPAVLSPTIPTPAQALSLSAGTEHTLLLTNDGKVRTWGDNELAITSVPTVVTDSTGAISGSHHPYAVSAGDMSSFAASTDGTVAVWGVDSYGQFGRTTTGTLSAPTLVTLPGTTPTSGVNTPATIVSRQGATYVVTDAAATRPSVTSWSFGSFPTTPAPGQTAPTKTISFTNSSTKPLTISSLTVDGQNPGDFTLSANTCTGTLAVDATCSVTVTFSPTGTGARQASLNFYTGNYRLGLPLQTLVPLTGSAYTSVAGLANLKLDLAPGSKTTVSGPGNILSIKDIDPKSLPASVPASSGGSTSLTKLPLADTSLTKLPVDTSLTKLPFSASLTKLPVVGASLTKLPLSLSLTKLPLDTSLTKLPVADVSLTKLPILRQGGWPSLLAAYPNLANVPISSLRLGDLLDPTKNQPDPSITTALPLDRVSYSDIDIPNSAFARISIVSLLAGDLRLDQFSGLDWCSELAAAKQVSCSDGRGLQRLLLELDFAGADLSLTSVGNRTLGSLVTDSLSTTGNPLDDDGVLPVLPLSTLNLPGTDPGALPLSSLPNLNALVDCSVTDCTTPGRTLADLVGSFRSTATVRDLGTALNSLSLDQWVQTLVDRSKQDIESIPDDQLPLSAFPNREYEQADVDINCFSASGTTVGLKLPAGFKYVPGTTTLTRTRGTGTVPLADPVVDATRGLVVSVPDSSFSSTGPIACTNDSAHLTVSVGVLPTGTAGTYQATGDVRTGSITPLTATQTTPLAVTGINQPPDDTPDGPTAATDTVVLGSITAPGQPAYIPFVATPGQTVTVSIVSPVDVDGVLYYPVGARRDAALSDDLATQVVPFGEAPAVDASSDYPLQTAFGGALQDVPLLSDRQIAALAATRGTDTEQLSATARAGSSDNKHVLAVVGYNRAVGKFRVHIRVFNPPVLPTCTTPAIPAAPNATSVTYSGTPLAATDTTAVLVNTQRLAGRFGGSAATALAAADSFVHSAGISGQVLQLDSDASVRAAYAAWDTSSCDPLAADGVVRAITSFLHQNLHGAALKYVVLVGGDDQIPHARLEDHTRDASERDEAADLALTGSNPLSGSLAQGFYLSDDPYGTTTPAQVLGQVIYQPQAVPGRVGESASDIAAQFDAFRTSAGVADPTTGTSTPRTAVAADYDLLTPGGNQVASALTGAGYTTTHDLSGSTRWSATRLVSEWLGAATVPGVAALNMHYDQYRGLPADGDQNNLYTSTTVANGPSLSRRVVLTIGCHSALDVPDTFGAAGAAEVKDFAQTYAGKGLAVMIGNLGYGYADSSSVAYSAQLQAYLAQGIKNGYDLGTALSEAKRLYVDRLAGLSAYDLKSAQEMILWGLPQYRTSQAPATAPPAPPVTVGTTDPYTQETTQAIPVNGVTFSTKTDTGGSTHLEIASSPGTAGTVAPPGKPVLPAVFLDVPQVAGKVVRSVVPTALTSTSSVSTTATFAQPMIDHQTPTEPTSVGVFPATLGHLGTAVGGGTNQLVVTPAEFQADGNGPGTGTIRTFPSSEWTAYYGPAGDAISPTITNVLGTRVPAAGSSPAVTSYGITVNPATNRLIKRVYVLAAPGNGQGGAWVRTELSQDSLDSGAAGAVTHWTGAAVGALGEFIVVAIADDGTAAFSNKKGGGWGVTTLPASITEPQVQLQLSPGTPSSGWFTQDPQVNILDSTGNPPPTSYRISIDGGSPVPSGTFVHGDGVHLVRLVRPDGTYADGAQPVLIDTVVPVVRLSTGSATRYELHEQVPYTVDVVYGASGQRSLTVNGSTYQPGQNLPTSTAGANVLNVVATSVAGLSNTAGVSYRVVYGSGSTGFLSPVASTNGLNLTVRTLVYGFSWHLVDHYGADVSSGDETGNTSAFADISCPSTSYKIQLPKLSGATAQPVSQGSGVWNWDLAMPNPGNVLVCKHLTVTTNDGFTQFGADVQISP